MNKESFEHLSSLMDGEMSRETGLFMTRRLSSDQALCDAWRRYHLIRDCLRQPGSAAALDLSVRVRAALASERVELEQPTAPGRRWLRPVTGVAIAASVALMAVVMVGPGRVQDNGPGTASPQTAAAPFTSPNTINLAPASQPVSFSPRLNSYLLRHNQLARSTGQQGFVSFMPMISAQARTAEEPVTQSPADTGQTESNSAVKPR